MADGPIIYPRSYFGPNPLEQGLDNFMKSYSWAQDTQKKSDLLERQLRETKYRIGLMDDENTKQTGGGVGNDAPTTQNLPAIGGSGSDGGSSGGGGGGGGGGQFLGGDKSALSPDETYNYMTQTLGWSPTKAALGMSAIENESGFHVHQLHDMNMARVPGGGYGLVGYNTDRLQDMRRQAGVGPNDPVPYQAQLQYIGQDLDKMFGDRINDPKLSADQLAHMQLQFERPQGWNASQQQLDQGAANYPSRLKSTQRYMGYNPAPPGDSTVPLQAGTGPYSFPDVQPGQREIPYPTTAQGNTPMAIGGNTPATAAAAPAPPASAPPATAPSPPATGAPPASGSDMQYTTQPNQGFNPRSRPAPNYSPNPNKTSYLPPDQQQQQSQIAALAVPQQYDPRNSGLYPQGNA